MACLARLDFVCIPLKTMAKATAISEKPAKLSKKKSQDFKADKPAKTKKGIVVEDQSSAPLTDPSSSKPKKAKKSEDGTKDGAESVKAEVKKGKKKESPAVEQPKAEEKSEAAPVEKKRKRKAAEVAVEEASAQPAKETKKKRASVVEPVTAVEEKVEDAGDKKKKRKSVVVVEDKGEESADKLKKKRKDASSEVKTAEPVQAALKAPAKEAKKSKAKAAPPPEPEPEVEAEDAAEEEAEAEDFFGFESDDDDSSDEEMADDIPGIDIGKLPTVAKDDETVRRKLEKAKRKPVRSPSIPLRVLKLIALAPVDRGPWCDLSRTDTSRVLRGTDARVLLAVR